MTQFTLRNAAPADEAAIRSIVGSVMSEYGLKVDPAEAHADLADVQSSYIHRGGVFRVLLADNGTVVGCGGLYPISEVEAEIRKMYFLPSARGRGYGRRLLTELVQEARARGYRRVVLETASVLKEAIALYKSADFKPYNRERISCRCDQAMVLDLE